MPNFRISFGDGINSNNNQQQPPPLPPTQQQQSQLTEQQEQLYVKVGETNPPSEVYVNWSQNQNHHHNQQQIQQQNRYHEKHRKDIDKDMIYAPSGNRSIISYVSANNRFDDV